MISDCERLLLWTACSGFFVWGPWHLAKFMKVGRSLLWKQRFGGNSKCIWVTGFSFGMERMKVVGKLRTGL